MKVTTKHHSLVFVDRGIEFTTDELTTLRKASFIAAKARELARTIVPNFEIEALDTLLAEVEHNARDLVESNFLIIETEEEE